MDEISGRCRTADICFTFAGLAPLAGLLAYQSVLAELLRAPAASIEANQLS